jgi:putative DNA primase/helicase
MVDKTKRGGPDEAITSLQNKRLVCSTELEDGQRLSVSLVKRMTGGEPLWGEHKFERGYNFQPTHKLWLSGNHEPGITDTTNSIWGRLKKIPFTVEIPEADRKKGYAEYLASEHGAAILTWLVQGCSDWRKAGSLGEPEVVTQAVAEYRDQQDILHDYQKERCIFARGTTIDQKALYTDYKKWAEDNDVNPIGKGTFRTRMREKGAITDYGNKNIAIWRGIRLRTDSDDNVNSVNSVKVFAESFTHEASTGKTLGKMINTINTINPLHAQKKDATPATNVTEKEPVFKCYACGSGECWYRADGERVCYICHPPVDDGPDV